MKSNYKNWMWVGALLMIMCTFLLSTVAAFADTAEDAADAYRQARRALNKDKFVQAADLFAKVHTDYADSDEAPDALYYNAYALFRQGDSDDLHLAVDLLERLEDGYPDALFLDEVESLNIRIRKAQAKRGDIEAKKILEREIGRFEFDIDDEAIEDAMQIVADVIKAALEGVETGTAEMIRALEDLDLENLESLEDLESDRFAELVEELAERQDMHDFESLHALYSLERLQALNDRIISIRPRSDLSQDMRARLSQSARSSARSRSSARARSRVVVPWGNDERRVLIYDPHDFDNDIQISALQAMLNMDPDRALPIVEKLLLNPDDYDAELREKALFILAQSEDEKRVGEIILKVVRDDPDRDVRERAVFWLSQVPGDEACDALELVLEEGDQDLKEQALFALAQHDSKRSHAALRKTAADRRESDDTREQAIFWLSRTSGSDTVEFLKSLYVDSESLDIKKKILFSVSQSGGRDAQDWLLGLAKDRRENDKIRVDAIFWANQSDHIRVDDLAELYDELDSREVRGQVIFVLSRHDSPEAVDELIRIAKNDPDPELRHNAVFWLGQSDDPRVLDLLEEIITGK